MFFHSIQFFLLKIAAHNFLLTNELNVKESDTKDDTMKN